MRFIIALTLKDIIGLLIVMIILAVFVYCIIKIKFIEWQEKRQQKKLQRKMKKEKEKNARSY